MCVLVMGVGGGNSIILPWCWWVGGSEYTELLSLPGSLPLHQQPEATTITLVPSAIRKAPSKGQVQFLHRKKHPFQVPQPPQTALSVEYQIALPREARPFSPCLD